MGPVTFLPIVVKVLIRHTLLAIVIKVHLGVANDHATILQFSEIFMLYS